eukprot:1330659-Amorphochlora_amoeboformis.AAC.1
MTRGGDHWPFGSYRQTGRYLICHIEISDIRYTFATQTRRLYDKNANFEAKKSVAISLFTTPVRAHRSVYRPVPPAPERPRSGYAVERRGGRKGEEGVSGGGKGAGGGRFEWDFDTYTGP